MNTVLMFRAPGHRQHFGSEIPDDMTVEDSLRAVCQPVFAGNPGLPVLEFRLIDKRRSDGLLSEEQRTTAVNDARKPTVVPVAIESAQLQHAESSTEESAFAESSTVIPLFRRKMSSKPVFPDPMPPSAA